MLPNERRPVRVPDIEWNWDRTNYLVDWHEPIFSLLAKYIPKGSKLLEVGAGGSHTLGALAGRLRCRAFGIEPDEYGIRKTTELAAGESAEVEMIRGDGFYLPFADGEFDVVYSLGLVEHFIPDDSEKLLAEHYRVCKSGGLLIVAVPNTLNLPHTFRKAYLGNKYEYFPERSYTPGQLKKMLTSKGVQLISTDGVLPLWGLGMSKVGWRLVALLKRIGIANWINNMRKPHWRAAMGYMTYAIGRKQNHG